MTIFAAADLRRRRQTHDAFSTSRGNCSRHTGTRQIARPETARSRKLFRRSQTQDCHTGWRRQCERVSTAESAARIRPRNRETPPTREAMIMLLQLAIAVLLGRAVTHVLESFANT